MLSRIEVYQPRLYSRGLEYWTCSKIQIDECVQFMVSTIRKAELFNMVASQDSLVYKEN